MLIRCPVCGARKEYKGNPYRPFCSERCKQLDFLRWAQEDYRIQEQDTDDDDEVED